MFFHVFLCFSSQRPAHLIPHHTFTFYITLYSFHFTHFLTLKIIMKKETIKWIIQILISILSAAATALGTTSCIAHLV